MKEKSTVSNKAILTDDTPLKTSEEEKPTQTADFDFFDTIEPVKNERGSGLFGKGDP